MMETWNYSRCTAVLGAEIGLLKIISSAQDKVRQAVMNREWADFDGKISEVSRLGAEFGNLEDERVRLISALDTGRDNNSPGGAEKPFYALIAKLPMPEKRELARLYRELKMETLRMQAVNKTFLAYLNEAKTAAAAYLEAVCPERGGKLYTRKGRLAAHDMRSIVFNNRF